MADSIPFGYEAQHKDLRPGSEHVACIDVNHLYATIDMVRAAPPSSPSTIAAASGRAIAEEAIRRYERFPDEVGTALMTLRQIATVADCIDHLREVPECQPARGRIEFSMFFNAREALALGISIDEVVKRRLRQIKRSRRRR